MTDGEIKKLVGRNIYYYRTKANMKQSELGDLLSYSDKSISKWECGDGIPDVIVLKKMSEIWDISINDFFTEEKKSYSSAQKRHRILIPIISVVLCYFVASIIFFLLSLLISYKPIPFIVPSLVFVFAIPISAIILLVFSKIWWTRTTTAVFVSLLDWTAVLSLHLTFTFAYHINNIELIYIAAAIFQIMTVLWFIMKGKKEQKPVRITDENPEE